MSTYTIPGKPIAWMRARRRGNKYFDIQMKEKERMRSEIRKSKIKLLNTSVPIKVVVECHMPIPKSWAKIKQKNAVYKPHVSRPDADNIMKFIGDALNGLLWTDDSLIYEYSIIKFYGPDPKTLIHLEPHDGLQISPTLS